MVFYLPHHWYLLHSLSNVMRLLVKLTGLWVGGRADGFRKGEKGQNKKRKQPRKTYHSLWSQQNRKIIKHHKGQVVPTSLPSAVYTSLNSRPIYPLPTIAIHSGTNSNLSAWSLVITVLPVGIVQEINWYSKNKKLAGDKNKS